MLNTAIPPSVALLVLVVSAVRLSAWRGVPTWPAIALAGLLAGVGASRLFSDISTFNCFAFGASFTHSGIEDCDAGVR
jgi:hypothetical protein